MATSAPRIAALVALAGAAVVLTVAGVSVDLTHLDAARIADRVRASGALGPLTLIALLVAQAVVAPLPSPPLLMAAGYVYGPWVGFGIGWVGLLLGASACFGLARALGRPFTERFVRTQRLAAVDEYVSTRSGTTFLTVLSLRVAPAALLRRRQLRLRARPGPVPLVRARDRPRGASEARAPRGTRSPRGGGQLTDHAVGL